MSIDVEALGRALTSKRVSAWLRLIAKGSHGKWSESDRLDVGFARDFAADIAAEYKLHLPSTSDDDGSTWTATTTGYESVTLP